MNLQFEAISLEKQTDYLERLAKCPQVASDYSFINLWAWCEEYGLRWAWNDDLVWIKQTFPEVLLWAPIGPWQDVDWKANINANSAGRLEFIRVPEELANFFVFLCSPRASYCVGSTYYVDGGWLNVVA